MRDYTQVARPDFSLWAQPSPDSGIEDRAKNPAPLDPTQASPVNADDAPQHDNGGNLWDASPQPVTPPSVAAAAQTPPTPDQSRLGRLHDSLAGHFTGPTPSGYDGILTPEEIQAAKPSLLHSMFSLDTNENGKQQWQTNLDKMVAHKQQLAGIVQQQQMLKGRQADFAANPPPGPDATEEQQVAYARARALSAMSRGDYQAVQQIAQHFGSLFKEFNPNTKPTKGDPYVNGAGETRYFDTAAGSTVPAGWTKVKTAASSGSAKLFVNPKDPSQQKWVEPGDDTALQDVAKKGYVESVSAREQDVQKNTNARHSDSDVVGLQKSFQGNVKDLAAQAAVYDKALYTMNRAANSTDPNERKLLFGAVKSQFVQSSDQSKNLRFQLLQYYEHNIDPSFSGTIEQVFDKAAEGKIPDRLLRAMIGHVQGLQQETEAQIEARRQGFLNSNAGRLDDSDLPATITYFPFAKQYKSGVPTATAPGINSPAPTAADYKRWGITPVRKP